MASFDDDFETQDTSSGAFSEFLDAPAQEEVPYAESSPVFDRQPSFEQPSFDRQPSAGFVADSYSNDFQASPAFGGEPLAAYRRRHADFLDEKDRKAEEARQAVLAKAAAALEEISRKEAEKKLKHQAKNREEEKKFIRERDAVLDGSNYSNDWERVASLIDVKAIPIGRDTGRLRKLLIELKH
eukprot:TRINITY_DN1456_c0_g1_i1.p1 TRINITY_DN1456_c0_g1~~TRINITY_DN1456_c0_g1_i1.p1  ORF type:complete len:203 (+),score=70.43 TRINITY_DN1456_c0_g1_i1:60-611(+)